jgi:hypothetical protein
VITRNDKTVAHHRRRPHDHSTPQADDPGFSDRPRKRLPGPTPEHVLNTTRDLIAGIAGKLDSPINAVISPHFGAFVADVMQPGMKFNKLGPGANFCDIFPFWSHATMSKRLRKRGHGVSQERFRIIRHEHRFINLLCDTGTVKTIKLVHWANSNPTRLCDPVPLNTAKTMAG